MNTNQVILRCEDKQEAVVFTKYEFKTPVYHSDGNISIEKDIDYEISVEDSYIGGNYKGLFGRIKRAWRAFIDKPIVYTGIYCEDKDKMRQFLGDCLNIVEDTVSTTFPKLQPTDFIEVFGDNEMRFFCTDECEQFENVVHPDEDYEFKQEDITRVWRQVDNHTYKCIYRKGE
jgi:hypothetical protein